MKKYRKVESIRSSRLNCAQIVGWVSVSFDNINDERRLFNGFFKKFE
ncbi:hypothetical protein [Alkalibaculum bacchi]|nr:hypothetical protein [Alkalibaculum bacchi]